MFDLNLAPAITSTGRSLISSAILCFEGFLGNNVQFGSLNDILIFIDNVRMENKDWKYDDWQVLGVDGFVSLEECFNKLMLNCGYKYIPTEQDMDIVYKILQSCNQIELNRLFYKNNLYSFMDLPTARNLMISIITRMPRPFMEATNPPAEIKEDLDHLRDLLVEYVFYCHQYMDRVIRNKEMIKKVSVISDTDSSFVSLDAWYRYNLEYLKDYDSPILHQKIDIIKQVEKEEKSKDWWWKDKETPSWYGYENPMTNAITFMETDEFGDLKNPHDFDAIEFVEPERDYDFYKDEIIEKQRMIEPFKIIPQDNLKFALINIMAYILSTVINLYMIDFTKHSGSYRGDALCKINMKNEFYMSRIVLTNAKKNYASLQILQEGNYLGAGVPDFKGIDVLTKSSVSEPIQKAARQMVLEDMLTGKIDQLKLIKDIAIFEKTVYTELREGSKKYYKPVTIKSMDSYDAPMRIQGVKAAVAWNYLKGDLDGFDLGDRNSLDIAKIKVTPKELVAIEDEYPEYKERFEKILDPNNTDIQDGVNIGEVFKGKLDTIAIPKDTPVPGWLTPFIDHASIIGDALSNFPVSSVGISKHDSKKTNYSNIIKL